MFENKLKLKKKNSILIGTLLNFQCTALQEARGFPGGAVVKNPPADAGEKGSIPAPGKFYMPRGSEAQVPNACRPQEKPHNEKPVHRQEV